MQLSYKVEVPAKFKSFMANPDPYFIEVIEQADREALTLLRGAIAAEAPKKSGKLAVSITVDLRERKVFTPLVYARAVELGHYAEPINTPKKMFLSFGNLFSKTSYYGGGGNVFIPFVRTEKKPYFFKALKKNRAKVRAIYNNAIKKLLERI